MATNQELRTNNEEPSTSRLLKKGICHAECHMGLRPTNSNEHHGGAPSLILKDFARDVRRSVAKHLLCLIENRRKADPSPAAVGSGRHDWRLFRLQALGL